MSTPVHIAVLRTDDADPDIPLPAYETVGAAGADIRANFPASERVEGRALASGQQELIPTGLRFEIPEGYEVQIRPRSGLALKEHITLLNSPATIDSDYRGEVKVMLYKAKGDASRIGHGDRIAQIVVAPVIQAQFAVAEALTETVRGGKGFGSTGTG